MLSNFSAVNTVGADAREVERKSAAAAGNTQLQNQSNYTQVL